MTTVHESKEAARYQSRPRGGERCAGCSMIVELVGHNTMRCTVVSGDISPDGWCRHFQHITEQAP